MQRGQVSLELVLVAIVALSAAAAFSFLSEQSMDSQKNRFVQNQAQLVAFSTATRLKGLLVLQNAQTGNTIEIQTPAMELFNPTFLESCTVNVFPIAPPFANAYVQVLFDKENNGSPEITVQKATVIPDGFAAVSYSVPCGQSFQWAKT